MSSTNKTEHLALNQWVGTDPFRMADFNEDNQKIDAAFATKANIAFGSYIGNGDCGQAHPTRITFPFEPKVVWIQNEDGRYRGLFVRGATSGVGSMSVTPYCTVLNCAWLGNTLTWHDSSANPWLQLNYNDLNYIWFALY